MKNYFLDEAEKIGCDMKSIQHFKNSKLLWKAIKTALEKLSQEKKNEWIILLCKGSQNTIFLEESVKILLKNQADSKQLVRQSEFWLSKKK